MDEHVGVGRMDKEKAVAGVKDRSSFGIDGTAGGKKSSC